jgi:hypothetical protein
MPYGCGLLRVLATFYRANAADYLASFIQARLSVVLIPQNCPLREKVRRVEISNVVCDSPRQQLALKSRVVPRELLSPVDRQSRRQEMVFVAVRSRSSLHTGSSDRRAKKLLVAVIFQDQHSSIRPCGFVSHSRQTETSAVCVHDRASSTWTPKRSAPMELPLKT